MSELKFVEVDEDKFVRLDEIKAFYKEEEIILTGDFEKPAKNYSFGVITLSDGSKSNIPIEYYEKLKKAVKNENNV